MWDTLVELSRSCTERRGFWLTVICLVLYFIATRSAPLSANRVKGVCVRIRTRVEEILVIINFNNVGSNLERSYRSASRLFYLSLQMANNTFVVEVLTGESAWNLATGENQGATILCICPRTDMKLIRVSFFKPQMAATSGSSPAWRHSFDRNKASL